MDITWLYILVLPALTVGLILGWVLRSWIHRSSRENHSTNWSESYAKGLNYLLVNDSDRAIQTFIDLVEIDQNTIEIHITLGNLFRSKGEVDRAIKIHQNLLARPNLTKKQRNMAVAELAEDFLKAGLHDRAEKLYREMAVLQVDEITAYERLLDLYVAEKSWYQASECAQILYDRGVADAAIVLSQCYCEIAQLALADGNRKLSRINLEKALTINHNCVRAGLLLIDLHLSNQNYTAARKLLQRFVKHNPEYMVLYIQPAKAIYLHAKESKVYQNFLQHQYEINPSNRLAIALLEHYASTNQIDRAREFLNRILKTSPSFDAFDFALRFIKSEPGQPAATWESLSEFLKNMQGKKIEFVCSNCGYGSHSIQWHCPSCNRWATMKAV